MEDKISASGRVCQFNYEQFLSYATKDKIDFGDVIRELFVTSHHPDFYSNAIQHLSLAYSDTDNILRLIDFARREGVINLDVILPYALDEQQVDVIRSQSRCRVESQINYQDRLLVTMYDYS